MQRLLLVCYERLLLQRLIDVASLASCQIILIILMLTTRAQGLAGLLIMVGLIGCIEKFDYNCVVGLGLLALGSKHAYLNRLPSFYIIVGAIIAVDITSVVLLPQEGVFSRFILTSLEILIKIGIIASMLLSKKVEDLELGQPVPQQDSA